MTNASKPVSDLISMVTQMSPELLEGEFRFCTITMPDEEAFRLYRPIATMIEKEGTTFVVPEKIAIDQSLEGEGPFRQITLQVHSSLNAYGLTAVFATALAREEISANVIAGYFHDHLFVPEKDAARAFETLIDLANDPSDIIQAILGRVAESK